MSIISKHTYTSLWPVHLKPSLKPSDVKLQTYTQEAIPVLGSIPVTVTYKQQCENLSLLVISESG